MTRAVADAGDLADAAERAEVVETAIERSLVEPPAIGGVLHRGVNESTHGVAASTGSL